MSRLTQLRFGVGAVLVLVLSLVWMPMGVSAGPEEPTSSRYGDNYGYGNDHRGDDYKDYNDDYKYDKYDDEDDYNGKYDGGKYEDSKYDDDKYNGKHEDDDKDKKYEKSHSSCMVSHWVKKGENLTWIAKKHGVKVEDLAERNKLKDTDLIIEGQELCIPVYDYDHGYGKDHYEKDDYGKHDYDKHDYDKDDHGYGDHDYGYPVAGQSYDPNDPYGKHNYGYDYDHGYGDRKGYDKNHGYDLRPGESRWSSD